MRFIIASARAAGYHGYAMLISPEQQQTLLETARRSIRQRLAGEKPLTIPLPADPLLCMPAGCFVSLHSRRTHRLRGCIGHIQSSEPLIKTVFETAQSCLQDPRFNSNPVTLAELPTLELEVSILSPLQTANDCLDFDPSVHGIYLIIGNRTGTFLPQVARQTGWSREQLLARLCTEKMGLSHDAWRAPDAKLLRYQAFVIGPVPFDPPARAADNQDDLGLLHTNGKTFRI